MKNDDWSTVGTGFQYLQVKMSGKSLLVMSIHGISLPGDKLDTPDRLIQSEKIKNFTAEVQKTQSRACSWAHRH